MRRNPLGVSKDACRGEEGIFKDQLPTNLVGKAAGTDKQGSSAGLILLSDFSKFEV